MKRVIENIIEFYKMGGIMSKRYCEEIFHEEVLLEWYSSKGFLKLELQDLLALSKDLRNSYDDLTGTIHKIIAKGNECSIFYTFNVRTNEAPDEELVLASFMVQWEIKDGKLYRGWQMSQLLEGK